MLLAIVFVISACGAGVYEEEYNNRAINAVDVSNKARFQELAENKSREPVTINVIENIAYMRGTLDSTLPLLIENLIEFYPHVDTLVLTNVPGTIDFNATLEAGYLIRLAQLTTVVPYNGYVASGGVHLFLAGEKRIVEEGSKLGIHQWKIGVLDNKGQLTQSKVASEFTANDPAHSAYINYQATMGIPEEFYWLLVNTPNDKLHYLTPSEIESFTISTVDTKSWGAEYALRINSESDIKFGSARFYVKESTAVMHGTITSKTAQDFQNMLADHPEVDTLEFGYVTGSVAPEINSSLELGYAIRNACLTTTITKFSDVFPGAVNSFIAGCDRNFEEGGRIAIAYRLDFRKSPELVNKKTNSTYLSYYDFMGIQDSFYSYQLTIPESEPVLLTSNILREYGII